MPFFSRRSKPARAPQVIPGHAIPATPGGAAEALEPRIHQIGRELLDKARGHKAGLLSARFYSDKLMDWSMRDPAFKVQLFRFVDAFPMLKTPEAIHEHLLDYLTQPGVKLPPGMDFGLKVGGLAKGLAAATISKQIRGMAEKFIAGTDAASALPGLRDLWKEGIAFSVDLLGEACVSEAEADEYQRKYLDLVNNLPSQVSAWAPNERLETDHLGAIPRVNVSIKISSLSARTDPIDTEGSIKSLMVRLLPILEAAKARGVFVNFDMEQFALKDLTIELFQRCCETVDFHAGLAMQAYLKSGPADARRICEWSKRTGRTVSVRLVKGAYWDYETIHAEQMGWPCPVWPEKWQTDACFEEMTSIFLDAAPGTPSLRDGPASGMPTLRGGSSSAVAERRPTPGVKLALGSHNARSIAAALAGLESRGLPRNAIELQMLHGMADQLKHAAAEMGLRVREYVPVGEMIPGMAYLVRRLLENTSNESWLKAGFLDNADPAALLRSPSSVGEQKAREGGPKSDLLVVAPERHQLSVAVEGIGDGRPFFNESMRDFSDARTRQAFAKAIAGATVPKVANDRTPEHARDMVTRAAAAFPAWRDLPVRTRSEVLVRAAALMRAQRDGLAGVMIKEAGKTWREADADVCEAIDFCEFYAREAVPLFDRQRLGRFIGELDEHWHQPRGVAVVISPWNFPLAIMVGMTVAALVTGNTVVLKPAEQTPGIARVFYDILKEALGTPTLRGGSSDSPIPPALASEVLHFCPGQGETTGASLVRDPRIALIAFTGSKAVGLDIVKAAGVTSEEQEHVKKVVCEMGGKNAVIVDTSADFDEAVLGVRASAFGFQGQKCSACSRVIVVDPDGPTGPAISTFTRRFVEATKALVIGDPILPGSDIGPVIDSESADKIRRYIDLGTREAKLELAMLAPEGLEARAGRRYVGPHIFSGVRPEHAIAKDEIFGPVVAILHAPTFEAALDLANASIYKLTGGVFSRKPSHLDMARDRFRVGNLYLNRGITGALVARQPFGGFGMSGLGSKAGGREYLQHFVEPRACAENTLRRGFAPEL